MESAPQPKGSYRLVTVNKVPERAKALIGRVAEALQDSYKIVHFANCESMYSVLSRIAGSWLTLLYIGIAKVEFTVLDVQPDMLVRNRTSRIDGWHEANTMAVCGIYVVTRGI